MAAASNSKSHTGFFVALLVVVAIGAGGYWVWLTYGAPVSDQKQTADLNPGRPHPPKDRGSKADEGTAQKPAVDATPGDMK